MRISLQLALQTLQVAFLVSDHVAAQCGGFLRRPDRLQAANTTSLVASVGNHVGDLDGDQSTAAGQAQGALPVTELVQCWWQFRVVTPDTRFRYKVTWRHVVHGVPAASLADGTPWRVLLEYDGDVAEISRVRGGRLVSRTARHGAYVLYLFEGSWNGAQDSSARPVIRFSYMWEFPVSDVTPVPMRFTFFLQQDDIASVQSFARNNPSTTTTTTTTSTITGVPSSKDMGQTGEDNPALDIMDSVAGQGDAAPVLLDLADGRHGDSLMVESPVDGNGTDAPATSAEYDVVKRRRTEAWVMAMCVIVGLSIGLILMATCVHPTRCIAFWRKRRRPSASNPDDSSGLTASHKRALSEPAVASSLTTDGCHSECNCRHGQYARSSVTTNAECHSVQLRRGGGELTVLQHPAGGNPGPGVQGPSSHESGSRSHGLAATAFLRTANGVIQLPGHFVTRGDRLHLLANTEYDRNPGQHGPRSLQLTRQHSISDSAIHCVGDGRTVPIAVGFPPLLAAEDVSRCGAPASQPGHHHMPDSHRQSKQHHQQNCLESAL